MAEFALGLTKTAVEGTLSRVKSAIEEETTLMVRVQDDLVFITGEFQMMQSFLKVANVERVKNEVVRTWVRQLRDLAFDIEDCVEFVVHLDKASHWDWLRRLTSSLMCMSRPPLPLDKAVADIKRLKTRVEVISQRNTRYNLISDSGSGSGSGSDSKTTIFSLAVVAPGNPASASATSAFNILSKVWDDLGKKRHGMSDLKRLIQCEGNDLQVISLLRRGGGAATAAPHIIREAYNDLEIRQEFSIRAWVKLIRPFNPDEFLKSLITQFYAASSHQFRAVEDHRLIKTDEVMQQVREHRYLVILENVSTPAEWDVIRVYLPGTSNGSRIIVLTEHLGLAISCTGKPYQVSELRRFSQDQPLCAFFSKVPGRRSDMSELCWQLRRGDVISVWGFSKTTTEDDRESMTRSETISTSLLDSVYTSITRKSKGFIADGVEFEKHSWVDVPYPFDINVFCKHLLLSFYSDDFGAEDITALGDRDHEEERVINFQDLESDMVLHHLIKGCEYYGIGVKEAWGRLFSNRIEEACNWTKKFGHVVRKDQANGLVDLLKDPGVISVCGTAGAGKLPLVRRIFYHQLLITCQDENIMTENYRKEFCDLGFTLFSWVDVPHPFSLKDFGWRLVLGFSSNDLKEKETMAVLMMEGQLDSIQDFCREFMHKQRCFVVINGLRSMHDWNLISDAFISSEHSKCCTVVITNEASVARHCADKNSRILNIKGVEAETRLRPLIKDCGYYGNECGETSRFFSNRREETRHWANTFEPLVGRQRIVTYQLAADCLEKTDVGVGKSALVRCVYSKAMLDSEGRFTSFGWVNVPHPFDLIDFCWHLLADIHSDDHQAKETAVVAIIDGAQDPIQECRKFLHTESFVVIDGLHSTHDWDVIREALLPETTKGCIIVISNEINVATHCVPGEGRVINVKNLEPDAALHLLSKCVGTISSTATPLTMQLTN
ncbi:hypothetical protein CFC21_106197 [Triticum aestivum]|uniref:Rx N-terminal domain-containing protein n=2 Tax=Triticum aestivum TaxID=4565 RepID=A0A9R1N9C4_WHEAT|nr:hypothetical protein CFC21_106197 [Triticum aestivum]